MKKLDTQGDKKPMFTEHQIKVLREELKEKGLSDKDFERFQIICERTRLDPFVRQIYARAQNVSVEKGDGTTGWEKQLVIITSIDGLRAVAESSGEYRGQDGPFWCSLDGQWKDVWVPDQKYPMAAKVGIIREGFAQPLYGVARFDAYVQLTGRGDNRKPNHFWAKMPDVLTAKCAEANAIRRAFPQLLSGIYIEEEVHENGDDNREEAIAKAAAPIGKPVETVTTPNQAASQTSEASGNQSDTPDSPKKERKKRENKAEKAPETPEGTKQPEEPKKPATDQQTQSPATPAAPDKDQKNAVLNFRLTVLNVAKYKDKQLGELSLEDLQIIKQRWIDANPDRIKADPAKKEAADNILKAIAIKQDEESH